MRGLVREGKRWARRRLWLRNHARTLRRASVVFISPSKCGRTWVRALLSHGYHQAFATPSDKLVDADVLHAIDPRVPIFFFTHISNESDGLRRRLEPAGQDTIRSFGLSRACAT